VVDMSTSTFEQLGPVLVSELPPVRTVRLTLAARVRETVTSRLHERAFERALRSAGPAEQSDLLALSRRG
jgi:hypothetical protein